MKQHHYPPAREIVELTLDRIHESETAFCYSVGGESGSGKSTLSLALKEVLEEKGFTPFIFHMDDYFRHPPQDNYEMRLENIGQVGPEEVNLELLQQHINQVKKGAKQIRKPLVHYLENQIRQVIVDLEEVDIVIAEGTYTTLLGNIDCRIFMLRDYRDTYEARKERARDQLVPFNEKVLEIEHRIIRKHASEADILIDKEYSITVQTDRFGR
ncbi:MAG: hypothetical protein R3211_09080 [Balneolaceae bacterium]|nr:hypothetical protein [Balneolaceae bacterium]